MYSGRKKKFRGVNKRGEEKRGAFKMDYGENEGVRLKKVLWEGPLKRLES